MIPFQQLPRLVTMIFPLLSPPGLVVRGTPCNTRPATTPLKPHTPSYVASHTNGVNFTHNYLQLLDYGYRTQALAMAAWSGVQELERSSEYLLEPEAICPEVLTIVRFEQV